MIHYDPGPSLETGQWLSVYSALALSLSSSCLYMSCTLCFCFLGPNCILYPLFSYLFWVVLGLHCCMRAFSGCGEQWLLLYAVCRLLELWPTGLGVLQHAESSQTRDHSHVPCIGKRVLNYWTTREVLYPSVTVCREHLYPKLDQPSLGSKVTLWGC